ncbi:MAG: hypothetical protein V3U87_12950, partial [Methylococcaceae bacterium]
YAAIEVTKLGYGGATYIRSILQCDDRTITRGVNDLNLGLSNVKKRGQTPNKKATFVLYV